MEVVDRPREIVREAVSGADTCRFCGAPLGHTVVDLGPQPLANAYLSAEALHQMEPFFPLHVRVCAHCLLVQVGGVVRPEELFSDYAYFSSYSSTWLAHAKAYVDMITVRLNLTQDTQVVELASNDGYLLQYFVERGIPVLGVEPATNVAEVASRNGIPTVTKFFGRETARELLAEGYAADLLIGNNVLAHVPDLNGFVSGMKSLLKPRGVITIEFPHLIKLIEGNQFDTIYHEHYSYFSFSTAERVFAAHGLVLFDVEEIPTHGGSLRIYARHTEDETQPPSPRVDALRAKELDGGFGGVTIFEQFGERVRQAKRQLLEFLIDAKRTGASIVGYGAPAKGNTLLNFCGIRTDFIDYTVDLSPHKQGRFLPGSRIPIYPPERIAETRPDYVLILPWNLQEEITRQLAFIRTWGGQFVVPIPEARVLP